MRKSLAFAFIFVALFAANAFAVGEARITGSVIDPAKQPLADVKITVDAIEGKTFHGEYKTDKKGKFAIFILDGTLKYKYVFAKEGYAPYEEIIKLKLNPEKNERTITLGKGGSGVAGGGGAVSADPAVAAFNAGVALMNEGEGKLDEALVSFQEAVRLKPVLGAGWSAITRIQARKENWPLVIENGEKALALDPEDPTVLTLLVDAYTKTGNKAKAAEYRKLAPANPTYLFNEAARLINSGKDKEAEPLLVQAVTADESFAIGHYELGILYIRLGEPAKAREHLGKYLELEPTGKDAATAKEMLKYVK